MASACAVWGRATPAPWQQQVVCLCDHEHGVYLPAPNRVLGPWGSTHHSQELPKPRSNQNASSSGWRLLLKRVWGQTGSRVLHGWLWSGTQAGTGLLSPLCRALPEYVPRGDRDQQTAHAHLLAPPRQSV